MFLFCKVGVFFLKIIAMAPIVVHGTVVPEISDTTRYVMCFLMYVLKTGVDTSFINVRYHLFIYLFCCSPNAVNMIGSMMMRGLECPFTWDNMIVFDDDDTNYMIDRLPLAVGPWDGIIQRCHLAFSEFKRNNIPRSLKFMAECYIPLVEIPGFVETKCELVKMYR